MVATTRTNRNRNAYAHLTDPARLKHVYNTLAKALSAAPVGELTSWEDVKAHVEQFSQSTGKAPIGMELCERDGEVCGFRFYLEQSPNERTSGSYLVKNLKAAGVDLPVEDHYFTPSSLSGVLGLEQSVALDDEISLDSEEQALQFDEPGLIDEAITPQRTQVSQSNIRRAATQPKTPTSAKVLDTVNHVSQDLARSNSAAIDGINLTGGTSQFATSTAAVAFALMKALDNPEGRYRSRLKRLANLATQQANRLDQLFDRAEDLEVASEPPEAIANPPEIAEPFTEAASVLTRQTNKLSKTLDSSISALQPLKLDRKAEIDNQLNQIEEYLQQLSERLDQLEAIMTRLEQQVAEQSEVVAALQKDQSQGLDVLDALVDEQPTVDHAIALRMIESFQQQVQFGDRAITFAWTDGEGQPRYEFDVTERQADGTQSMIGYSAKNRELVFAAVLSENKSPQINHCSISSSEIESLAQDLVPQAPEQSEPEPIRPQRQRQLNRQRLPEL